MCVYGHVGVYSIPDYRFKCIAFAWNTAAYSGIRKQQLDTSLYICVLVSMKDRHIRSQSPETINQTSSTTDPVLCYTDQDWSIRSSDSGYIVDQAE